MEAPDHNATRRVDVVKTIAERHQYCPRRGLNDAREGRMTCKDDREGAHRRDRQARRLKIQAAGNNKRQSYPEETSVHAANPPAHAPRNAVQKLTSLRSSLGGPNTRASRGPRRSRQWTPPRARRRR